MEKQFDSDYSVRLATLKALGGDADKHYHSVYDIDMAILKATEKGGSGMSWDTIKELLSSEGTDSIKIGDVVLTADLINSITSDIDTIATEVEGKQDILVSGENIKTINGEDILGEGNIEIQGGGMSEEDEATIAAAVRNIPIITTNPRNMRMSYDGEGNLVLAARGYSLINQDQQNGRIALENYNTWSYGTEPGVGIEFGLSDSVKGQRYIALGSDCNIATDNHGQIVVGGYNEPASTEDRIIVGAGDSDARSTVFTVKKTGDVTSKGNITASSFKTQDNKQAVVGDLPLKMWVGTSDEYDEITDKDANTIYLIKED